jgi:hypothetical protein
MNYATNNFIPKVNGTNSLRQFIGTKPLAVTEFNVTGCEGLCPNWNSNPSAGFDARSFIAGQLIADLFATGIEQDLEFMNMWSVSESSPDRGYIINSTGQPRSSYFHYQMLAQNFKGKFYSGTIESGATGFKAFAAKSCNGINIMVLNYNDNTTNTTYNQVKINLNGTMPSTSGSVLDIQIGTGTGYPASTSVTAPIGNEETLLIHCDPCGRPIWYTRYSSSMSAPGAKVWYPGASKSCACVRPDPANSARCVSTDTADILTLPLNFTIDDTTIFLPGRTIQIPAGGTLTIRNSDVAFSAGAKIEIKPNPAALTVGGRIIILNSYLHSCDTAAWYGLTLNGRGDTLQVFIDSSSFENALYPIAASNASNLTVSNSYFSNGLSAIQLESPREFSITGNWFENFITAISTSRSLGAPSTISQNTFLGASDAITFVSDNHARLTISCNHFYNYRNHAVLSANSALKNQGSSLQGAGNSFTSSSLLNNHQFSHSGNDIIYYTDPSAPFTLLTGPGMNASSITAMNHNSCSSASARQMLNEPAPIYIDAISLAVFPNPFNSAMVIRYALPEQTAGAILLITDITGREVYSHLVHEKNGEVRVKTSELTPGLYICRLITGNGLSRQIKIVHGE